MAVGVLEHGVPALQGGQRRERPGAGPVVGDVVGGPVEPVAEWCGGRGRAAASTSSARRVEQRCAGRPARAGRAARRAGRCSRVEPAAQRRAQPVAADARRCAAPRRRRARPAWRRRSASRRARRRPGRAAAGRARGRSRRRPGCGTRARRGSGLVGERQQVLDRAAAAGDDDHVDARRRGRGGRRASITSARGARALHRGVRRLEGDRGPAAPGVLEHVALGGGVRAR